MMVGQNMWILNSPEGAIVTVNRKKDKTMFLNPFTCRKLNK